MYLNCKTYYSLRYGTISTEALVQMAVDNGLPALALTNINTTCDTWDFVKRCQEAGIKPVAGAEVRNEDRFLYILLAKNMAGFAAINRFLSEFVAEKKPFPPEADSHPELHNNSDLYVIYPLQGKAAEALLPNERIGVLPAETFKLTAYAPGLLAQKFVVRQPVSFQDKAHYNLHRLLRAIQHNTLLSKLPPEAQGSPDEMFVPPAALLQAFKLYPGIVTNSYRLLESCSIEMDFKQDKNKAYFTASKEDDRILLAKLAQDGFLRRYSRRNKTAAERMQKELKIINDLGFNAYFLINNDIVQYAKTRGFYHVGRGSGANSIVAYCLGITDVDPIELKLFFERFLNPERTSPPDFDIDFSYTDRDEIMDYIFKRYGRQHVAICGSYSTFRHDAAMHELGKVFGLPPEEIKAVQAMQAPQDHIHRLIFRYAALLKGFPNIMSIHPCGMLITEQPITHYGVCFLPPKGFTGLQLDMFVAEDIGINKFDILSQRGLGHIRECLQLIKQNRGVDVDITDIKKFKEDKEVKTQIREAHTIGCFYIESPAMRQLLKKLRCDDYITLVAASSIIRPGVCLLYTSPSPRD